MRLLDLILRGGKTPEQQRQFLEEKLHLDRLSVKISSGLGQPLAFHKLRAMYLSKDDVISITPKGRILFHTQKMRKASRSELQASADTLSDGKNTFSKKHFEAVGEALDWECEIMLSLRGNAPALFKTSRANIWIAPIIKRETDGEPGQAKKA